MREATRAKGKAPASPILNRHDDTATNLEPGEVAGSTPAVPTVPYVDVPDEGGIPP